MGEPTTLVPLKPELMPVFLSVVSAATEDPELLGRRRSPRRAARRPLEFLRTFNSGDAELCRGQCVDVNEDGLGFVCNEPLHVGEVIQMYVPGETHEYTFRAKVVHVTARRGRYRVGVRFSW